jgi:hypothetical protein
MRESTRKTPTAPTQPTEAVTCAVSAHLRSHGVMALGHRRLRVVLGDHDDPAQQLVDKEQDDDDGDGREHLHPTTGPP